MKKALVLLLGILITQISFAQRIDLVSYDVEVGFNRAWSDTRPLDRIRRSAPSDDYFWSIGYDANMTNYYCGIKPEFAFSDFISADAGLRFTYTESRYYRNNSSYFYWLFAEDAQNTTYVRMNRIVQRSYWLGIPFDVRYTPWGIFEKGLYVKAGFALNCRLATKNDVTTSSGDMDKYSNDIADQIENPNTFAVPIWLGVGFQFGRHRSACIELTFPCFYAHAKMSSICKAKAPGVGLQFTYRIPNWKNWKNDVLLNH